jgi:hypothetical protein
MAIATAMYHTGVDPLSGDAVPVVRDLREKRMLKALILWWDEAQWPLAREALRKAGRQDLIGGRPDCLVPHDGARAARPKREARGHPPARFSRSKRRGSRS